MWDFANSWISLPTVIELGYPASSSLNFSALEYGWSWDTYMLLLQYDYVIEYPKNRDNTYNDVYFIFIIIYIF